jgi:hypothetical protein
MVLLLHCELTNVLAFPLYVHILVIFTVFPKELFSEAHL